jgi:arylesterase/paraoxonase
MSGPVRPKRAFNLTAVAIGLACVAGSPAFAQPPPLPSDRCRVIEGVTGAEDIAIDAADGLAFLSATDRFAPKGRPAGQDGLYVLRLADKAYRLTKLAGAPADFHPHGISLFRGKDGALTLLAINHLSDGTSSVVVFDVRTAGGTVSLTARRTVAGPLMQSPNDLAAVDTDRFYVSDDRAGKLLYFDGKTFQDAATGLKTANGVAISPDQAHVYVAETTGRDVRSFSRDAATGVLSPEGRVPIAGAPDNIDVGPDGGLWVAVHPDVLAFMAYFRDRAAKPSPSQVFRVAVERGVPASASLVYANAGDQIGAASVGAIAGRQLFIGTTLDSKVLACALP